MLLHRTTSGGGQVDGREGDGQWALVLRKKEQ